jgi:hypothetical protein
MMKQNSLKYILIVFVAAIWGIIIYKIFLVVNGPKNIAESSVIDTKSDSKGQRKDTFSIIANYPDPFLKSERSSKPTISPINNENAQKQTTKNSTKIVSQKKWPDIIFTGVVSNFTGNKSTILITINGSSIIMKKGDLINDVTLISIARDSIKLKFQDEYRYIKRHETK